MATDKKETDQPEVATPTSAPELSEDQKQVIEKALTTELSTAPLDKANTAGATTEPEVPIAPVTPEEGGRFKRLLQAYWRRKRWTLPLTLLLIIGLLAAVPATRYPLAAYVIKQDVVITITDASTKKPVSSADITLEGKTYKTDKDGKATVADVKVGKRSLTVSKKYFKDGSLTVFVPLLKNANEAIGLTATGRQVPVKVVNIVSGKPLEDATLRASGTEVKTDNDGKAVIVLPAEKADFSVMLSHDGFNGLESRIKVTDQEVAENTFSLTPSGNVYFLSRQSGKIDVVKTDLDGRNRQTVVAGTGKEEDANTVLLASRDWKYLALLSKRDSGLARMYLIDTSTDKMSEMDSGNASFSLVGWHDHDFVYNVRRANIQVGDANQQAIKSYNADKSQIYTIDQTASTTENGVKYYQDFGNVSIVGGKVAYPVNWQAIGPYYAFNWNGKNHSLRVATVSSSAKKEAKLWPAAQYSSYIQAFLYEPGGLYMSIYSNADQKQQYYEYENGEVKDIKEAPNNFGRDYYSTYLASPDGKRTFWSEQRDGRETFFVGDVDGKNGKQVTTVENGTVYGWYSDNYLLVSKKGNELYIMPVDGGTTLLKVSDYHKPQNSYRGYGGGYGGL